MKLSSGTIGFWINIAIFLVVGAAEAYLIIWVLSGDLFDRYSDFFPDLGFPDLIQRPLFWVILIICELLSVGGFLGSLKKQLIAVLSDSLTITKVNPEDYPSLDRSKLKQHTENLLLHGFTQITDFSAREVFSDRSKEIPGFSRLLINYETKCYAIVVQTFFPTRGASPVYCTIASVLNPAGSLINSNVPIDSVSLFWRNEPTDFWFSLPVASPEQLYRDHLSFRSQMRSDLSLRPQEVSENAYFEIEQQETKHRKTSVKNANILISMIKATWFELNHYHYWLGDYAKVSGAKAKAQEIVDRYGLS